MKSSTNRLQIICIFLHNRLQFLQMIQIVFVFQIICKNHLNFLAKSSEVASAYAGVQINPAGVTAMEE
jgi:hypothetical protein